jgi:sodium transport system permease protein
MAVFVLLGGASYAALSAFAGERESGTLETLLVQPCPSISIAVAKFAAVLLTGTLTLVLNAASVLVCLHFGLGTLPGAAAGGPGLIVDAGRLLSAAFLFLPAAVFLCAVLCLVCGRARTFREGQQMLLPLMLLALVPTVPATQPDVALDPILAAVPLCGPALALRDALRGEISLPITAWMFVANCGWAALVLTRLSGILDAERVMQHRDNADEIALRRVQSRNALRWAVVAVFAVYLVGSTLQTWDVALGLAATLWLLLLPLAFLSARGTASRANESVAQALWLRLPNPLHALGALLLAPALVLAARKIFELQMKVLPIPSSFGEVELFSANMQHKTFWMLALVALSPAICEEMFFRGALLSGLRRDLSRWRVVAWEMALFGAVHLSIYRFVPTALLGGVLTLCVLRARSIVPAMLLHGAYNALLVLQQTNALEGEGGIPKDWFDPRLAWLGIAGVACFLVRPRGNG